MRRTVLAGLALMWSAGIAPAAELRVLSVGSVQIAAKILADDFFKQTGGKVTLETVTPSDIPQKLADGPYDMVIASIPAMDALDQAGALRTSTRVPLARVGIGVMVREGAPVPDVSTPDAFKTTLLSARSIVATVIFMAAAIIVVAIMRHGFGGWS